MHKSHDDLVETQFGDRARNYVESAVHASGWDLARIAEIAAKGEFQQALDLGCGGGHVAYTLAPHVDRVVASDLSPRMLDAVRKQAEARGHGNIDTEQAAAESLPFENDSFDLLVSRYSVHHWREWEAGLREARRVTRPGGRLIFADVMAPENSAFDTHLQTIELLRDPSHVRDRSMGEWLPALVRAGLAPIAVHLGRLSMEFTSWVERMDTPEVARRAIHWLQEGAAQSTRDAFEIEADGSFAVDTIFIEAVVATS